VFRKINSVTDTLTKYGLSLSLEIYVTFSEFIPNFLVLSLCVDKVGRVYSC